MTPAQIPKNKIRSCRRKGEPSALITPSARRNAAQAGLAANMKQFASALLGRLAQIDMRAQQRHEEGRADAAQACDDSRATNEALLHLTVISRTRRKC